MDYRPEILFQIDLHCTGGLIYKADTSLILGGQLHVELVQRVSALERVDCSS